MRACVCVRVCVWGGGVRGVNSAYKSAVESTFLVLLRLRSRVLMIINNKFFCRCVPESEKALAIGFQWLFLRLGGEEWFYVNVVCVN